MGHGIGGNAKSTTGKPHGTSCECRSQAGSRNRKRTDRARISEERGEGGRGREKFSRHCVMRVLSFFDESLRLVLHVYTEKKCAVELKQIGVASIKRHVTATSMNNSFNCICNRLIIAKSRLLKRLSDVRRRSIILNNSINLVDATHQFFSANLQVDLYRNRSVSLFEIF